MSEEGEANKQKCSFLLSNNSESKVHALCCQWPKEKEGLGPSLPVVSVIYRGGGGGERGR